MSLIYPKGTKLLCGECKSHILTTAIDLHYGSPFGEAALAQDQGQGPWKNGERHNCRECEKNFFSGSLLLGHIIKPCKCEICEAEIPEGEKYCSECRQGVELNEQDESDEEAW